MTEARIVTAMPTLIVAGAVLMPGDLVDVACSDRAHAQWLRAQLRAHGVPDRSLTIPGASR